MTAKDVLEALTIGSPCPAWIRQAALLMYPSKFGDEYQTTSVNFLTEVTIRVEEEKVAKRSGRVYTGLKRYRMDLLGLVQAHFKNYQPFAVGVEIKVSESDLKNDTKLDAYISYCHLFYLAVPIELRDAAIQKINHMPVLHDCGLLTISGSKVNVDIIPVRRRPTSRCLVELYAELLIRPFKLLDTRAITHSRTFINFRGV